jgi:hypothetical protein
MSGNQRVHRPIVHGLAINGGKIKPAKVCCVQLDHVGIAAVTPDIEIGVYPVVADILVNRAV